MEAMKQSPSRRSKILHVSFRGFASWHSIFWHPLPELYEVNEVGLAHCILWLSPLPSENRCYSISSLLDALDFYRFTHKVASIVIHHLDTLQRCMLLKLAVDLLARVVLRALSVQTKKSTKIEFGCLQ